MTGFTPLRGSEYVDEPLLMDVNGDPSNNNDCDPDVAAQGETAQNLSSVVPAWTLSPGATE